MQLQKATRKAYHCRINELINEPFALSFVEAFEKTEREFAELTNGQTMFRNYRVFINANYYYRKAYLLSEQRILRQKTA